MRFFLVAVLIGLFVALFFSIQNDRNNKIQEKTILHASKNEAKKNDSLIPIPINSLSNLKLEIPNTNFTSKIIYHTGYSLLYNEKHEQANWVAYELTEKETYKIYERTNKFISDPNVKTETANNKDYKGYGYDRGHLAPASDMGWSETTMKESFFYSNMSPQNKSFNRGIWKRLEEQVRVWAIENASVYVVTGPILTNNLEKIGANNVSVPRYFYKVILDYTQPEVKGIGFILPNIGSRDKIQAYAVPIDKVEKRVNIDFFPLLEDNEEKRIESSLCIPCWSWKNKKIKNSKDKKSQSEQCTGITKSGNRCKRMTKNLSGRCYQH